MLSNKLEVIYQMIIRDVKLSRSTLNLRNVNDNDINLLLEENIIEEIREDVYSLVDVYGLFEYGVKLLENRMSRDASLCFAHAYALDPYNRDFCIQYISELIRKNNLDKALEVYKDMCNNIEGYDKENNLYLVLFSRFMSLDGDLTLKAKTMVLDDVLLFDSKENFHKNEIRKNIMHSKYTFACSMVNDRFNSSSEYLVEESLLKLLLSKVIVMDKKNKLELLNLVKDCRYSEVISILEDINKYRSLNKNECTMMTLCNVIVDALCDGELEYNKDEFASNIYNVYEAIRVKDYKLALDLNIEFLDFNDCEYNDDILYLLLLKINSLIEEFKNNEKIVESNITSLDLVDNSVSYESNLDIVEKSLNDENQYDSRMDMLVKDAENWAYYYKELPMSVDTAIRRSGLFTKYAVMVKLVLARDYFLSGDYVMGNKYLYEVESKTSLDRDVLFFLDEVKSIRDGERYTKKLVKY